MDDTPAGCGDDLPTILGTVKNVPKSRSINNFLQRPDVDPNSARTKNCFHQPKLRPAAYHRDILCHTAGARQEIRTLLARVSDFENKSC